MRAGPCRLRALSREFHPKSYSSPRRRPRSAAHPGRWGFVGFGGSRGACGKARSFRGWPGLVGGSAEADVPTTDRTLQQRIDGDMQLYDSLTRDSDLAFAQSHGGESRTHGRYPGTSIGQTGALQPAVPVMPRRRPAASPLVCRARARPAAGGRPRHRACHRGLRPQWPSTGQKTRRGPQWGKQVRCSPQCLQCRDDAPRRVPCPLVCRARARPAAGGRPRRRAWVCPRSAPRVFLSNKKIGLVDP